MMTSGDQIGRWLILGDSEERGSLLCRCSCGTQVAMTPRAILASQGKRCACRMRETRRAAATKHGESKNSGDTTEYRIWTNMRTRCLSPSNAAYADYGGRGIKVCERWAEFQAFLEDMGRRPSPDHSLDRKDNDGNYEPGNCRWATRSEQALNRRTTRILTVGGITKPLSQWARETGIGLRALSKRMRLGWDPSRAITEPLKTARVR